MKKLLVAGLLAAFYSADAFAGGTGICQEKSFSPAPPELDFLGPEIGLNPERFQKIDSRALYEISYLDQKSDHFWIQLARVPFFHSNRIVMALPMSGNKSRSLICPLNTAQVNALVEPAKNTEICIYQAPGAGWPAGLNEWMGFAMHLEPPHYPEEDYEFYDIGGSVPDSNRGYLCERNGEMFGAVKNVISEVLHQCQGCYVLEQEF